ncbi:MAG: hypothetical protein ACFFFB_01130 [Candidatus Heimdallarchaeota archaeon]
MDYKNFHDGLLSLSLVLFLFSFTFLIVSVILKPYIALEPSERDFIIIITSVNMIFSLYYIVEALRLNKIFKLDIKYIIKFAKRIGIISLLYIPNLFLFVLLLFSDLHNLQILMTTLTIFIGTLLLGVIFKEVYDLIFKDETERKFELEKNRKLYFHI